MRENAIILNTIAKAMNAGGTAIVSAFDAGTAAFNCTMSALSPGERSKLGNRIKILESKIRALHVDIAKETAKYPDLSTAIESTTIKAMHATIKELTTQIELMRQRIAELDRSKAEKKSHQESSGIANFVGSLSGYLPGEKASLQHKISTNEKKIQVLYYEFAKETAKHADPQAAITSEAIVGIVAKINELKCENDSLKLRLSGAAETKSEKPKPAEKKPQQESAEVAKFFKHALTDTMSKYLPIQKKPPVETSQGEKPDGAPGNEPASESTEASITTKSDTGVSDNYSAESAPSSTIQSDEPVIGYARTKPCLISTPAMQPPTREDIENITRVRQVDANQEEPANTIQEEHTDISVAPSDVEDILVQQETGSNNDEIVAIANESDKLVEEAVGSDEKICSTEEEPVSEERVVASSPIVAAVEREQKIDTARETEIEVASPPVNVQPGNEGTDKQNGYHWNNVSTQNGFENTRVRNQVTSFAGVSENPPVSPAPILGNEAAFKDESGLFYHTRVHQNITSSIAAPSETTSPENDADSSKATTVVKQKGTPLQLKAKTVLPKDAKPVPQSKLRQPKAPAATDLPKSTSEKNRNKTQDKSDNKKAVSPQKGTGTNATSQQEKNLKESAVPKKRVVPKAKLDAVKTAKNSPQKRK